MIDDPDRCYRAVSSRDPRFDGWFVVAVTSTGIYCRPSCPARTPSRPNVRFYATAAGAQAAGFRSCKRCRPDAVPGSPEWDTRSDVVARAMRLVADGTVDREGVAGLARRVGYSPRQLNRVLLAELGVGPLALARAHRAHTARTLIETTDLPFRNVAFAAGFSSVRQFNDTIRAVFDESPGALRARWRRRVAGDRAEARAASPSGEVVLRLSHRQPFASAALLGFLGMRAVPGVEDAAIDGSWYRRVLDLPHAPATVTLEPVDGHVRATVRLGDLRDLGAAVQRCRRLLDLDADPTAVDAVLAADPILAPLVGARPGMRVAGAVDGAELATRAVLGQQVSVIAGRTIAGRLTAALGVPLPEPDGALTHRFPTADAVAGAPDALFPMPASRRSALRGLATAIASGAVALDPGADREATRAALLALPGIGPWTASYLELRVLGDPDAFLPTDLGVRHALSALAGDGDPRAIAARAERWQPWRGYATVHLWESLS